MERDSDKIAAAEPGAWSPPKWTTRKRIILPLLVLILCLLPPVARPMREAGFKPLYILIFAWAVSRILTPIAIRLSFVLGWLDYPGGRKSHARPTPLLGGMAIIAAFGVALLVNSHYSWQMKGVGLAGLLIWIVGAVDDRRELPASLKLLVQLAAVGVLLYFDVRVTFLPNTWWGNSLEYLITAVWVLGITNSVNFLDGMDGLATGMSAIIAFFLALVALQTGQVYFAYVALALLGACLGLLPDNFRRTRSAAVFLGDNGATFLGFTLASTAIMGNWATNNIAALVVPILLLGVPIFDMVLTTVMRVYNGQVKTIGQWLAYTGRDHFHHRLAALGIGRYTAVLVIYAITILTCIPAVVLKQARGIDASLLLLQGGLLFLLISFFMIYVRSHQIRLIVREMSQEGKEGRKVSPSDLERLLTTADSAVEEAPPEGE